MAVNLFEKSINPVSGESFRCISFTDEAYVMEWTVQPNGYVPFEHIHLNQDEIFHVERGELRISLGNEEYTLKPGESIRVPKGKKHIAFNNKNEMLNCTVEYRPGLDHDKFMKCLVGLSNDNFLDKKGGVSIPRMGYCLIKMKAKSMARPTAIPSLVFNIALQIFYLRGALRGWSKLYNRYIND